MVCVYSRSSRSTTTAVILATSSHSSLITTPSGWGWRWQIHRPESMSTKTRKSPHPPGLRWRWRPSTVRGKGRSASAPSSTPLRMVGDAQLQIYRIKLVTLYWCVFPSQFLQKLPPSLRRGRCRPQKPSCPGCLYSCRRLKDTRYQITSSALTSEPANHIKLSHTSNSLADVLPVVQSCSISKQGYYHEITCNTMVTEINYNIYSKHLN